MSRKNKRSVSPSTTAAAAAAAAASSSSSSAPTGLTRRHSNESFEDDEDDSMPPFLPLEETSNGDFYSTEHGGSSVTGGGGGGKTTTTTQTSSTTTSSQPPPWWSNYQQRLVSKLNNHMNLKRVVSFIMFCVIGIVVWDSLFTAPDERWIQPDFSDKLLEWVQDHPVSGAAAIVAVIAAAVIVMVPIGTPLTLGCGYVYKRAYGWKMGLSIATALSMGGSALGAVCCFLLGRYLMRDQVRKWIKKYPIFDAIDVATAEHGLRIMAMLYLTPILPLGPVSYMCGTTSMALSSFVIAKIASLPLMLLYAFIGASMGALIGKSAAEEIKSIEENETLIVSGILLSFVMISSITYYIRKELNKILERQEKHKPGEMEEQEECDSSDRPEDQLASAVEMGASQTAPRYRKAAA